VVRDKSEFAEIRDLGIRLQKPKADLGEKPNDRRGKDDVLKADEGIQIFRNSSVIYGRREGRKEVHRTGNCEDDNSNRGTSVLAVADALDGTGSHNTHIQILSDPGRVDREGHPRAGEDMGKSFSTGLENREEHPGSHLLGPAKARRARMPLSASHSNTRSDRTDATEAELEDDLKRVGEYELQRTISEKGCTTLEAAC
jgi:hypothetical protein